MHLVKLVVGERTFGQTTFQKNRGLSKYLVCVIM